MPRSRHTQPGPDLLDDLTALEEHHLVGWCRIRLDVKPDGMLRALCACGAQPRDEAQHARHAARRRATGCDCTSGCPHDLPETTP